MSTAMVVGASRGIGLEFCRQLQARGDEVIAVCRTPGAELEALGVNIESGVDVTDSAALTRLASELTGAHIDILINNAGIMQGETIDELDFDSILKQFEVNSLGPLRTVSAMLPLLARPAKIALITSRMGSIADNTSGGKYGYRMSKCALNMAGVSLACDLREREIAVGILHPGFVRTDMTGQQGHISAEEAVTGLMARIDELNLNNTGTFWHSNGDVLPW